MLANSTSKSKSVRSSVRSKTARGSIDAVEQIDNNEHGMEEKLESSVGEDDESRYPPFRIVLLSVICLYAATFLASLDRTIIGVAIPAISNEFKSFGDIAWYEAAFLLTMSVAQLPMGKIYTFFPAKWTFFVIVVIFEIGSTVCASARSSEALIVGRAITGIGAAGIFVGVAVIGTDLVPLRKRPMLQGISGAFLGIASIIGPIVGGAFTTKASWRWCFWLNLCIGVPALTGTLFYLPTSPPAEKSDGKFMEKLWKFDPIGNILLAPGLVCMLLALQWGGTKYPWNNAKVLALIIMGSILLLGFATTQYFQESGTVPPRILRQRSVAAGLITSIGFGAALIIPTFYLPIWFQAIKGTTAVNAGVRLLPLMLVTSVFVLVAGFGMARTGYYTPWLIVGCAIRIVGVGLLTTLQVDAKSAQWIGYQVLVGIGTGMTFSPVSTAVQTVLPRKDIPVGMTVMLFAQFFSGTIAVSICQAVLSNVLHTELPRKLPGFDAAAIAKAGATEIRQMVSSADLPVVLKVYNKGISNTFLVALAFSGLALVSSLFVEWKSVKTRPPASGGGDEGGEVKSSQALAGEPQIQLAETKK
ncbi:hypothetical protein FKW77_002856 [Venturia effusa]|uniref:Major facilitator superfamily (MFS) profile domain-containing protein n=1 Tax=Venturia effusa TaxID=50376 RepID=A0A517LQV2_9PEZI|nr:hypothetical protein FKW77_002856 [Venturia effusa]